MIAELKRRHDASCCRSGADRIVADTANALASGVMFTPALFIDGKRYRGDLEPDAGPGPGRWPGDA